MLDCSKRKLEYKGPHDSDEPDKKGQVILDGGASVKPLSSSNSKFPKGANFGFEILTADGALELALENEEDMKSWMRTIQNAIQQDMIAEAKIQKKIYDDHVKRQNDRREAREKRKEEEADALLNSVIVKSTQNKVLEKQASSIQSFDEVRPSRSLHRKSTTPHGIDFSRPPPNPFPRPASLPSRSSVATSGAVERVPRGRGAPPRSNHG